MLISLEWLSDFLDLDGINANDLADQLSRTGLEVEGLINYGQHLNQLVVGQVLECQKMEGSDHLHITQVAHGQDQVSQIVCGAPNIASGQKVIVALPGAVLPSNFKIKKSKLRGHESNGMICSLEELGFSDSVIPKKYADGIFVLPEDAPVGSSAVDYLKLDDPILDIDITPNRADALSIRGVAYEVGAILNQEPSFDLLTNYPTTSDSQALKEVSIQVEPEDLSNHYQLRLIQDVTIQESPIDFQVRLMKSGIRPINNIVDLTNYFLLVYGQPMHAFDFDQLPSPAIKVGLAQEGQVFTTLDQVERQLNDQDILIYSGDTPVALAGVMGGLDSEVTNQTRQVLLETAVFDPKRVRSTSKRFGLRSESSARFEKGINPASLDEAGQQAAAYMAVFGQGQVVAGKVEHLNQAVEPVQVRVQQSAIKDKIGLDLSQEELVAIIDRLGFSMKMGEDSFTVEVPQRRWDISIEADILEEIARIYGYDRVPTTLPIGEARPAQLTDLQKLTRQVRTLLEAAGLNEVISYSLTSRDHGQIMKHPDAALVELALPLSEEHTVLRQSLLPSLLEVAQYNEARRNQGLAFYELGKIFLGQGTGKQPQEIQKIGLLISGDKLSKQWYQAAESYDFYDLKGIIESLLAERLLLDKVEFQAVDSIEEMHPGRTAQIVYQDQTIGIFGQIHPKLARDFDLSDNTYYAELDLASLLASDQGPIIQQAIPKFPASNRDLALLVDQDQAHQSLVDTITQAASEALVAVHLFDLYQGDNIAEGKKSLAYHLTFQDPSQTLTDEVIDGEMAKIQTALSEISGLEIR
ncbi:phenylalanine--tRNA ligase subunit beta [Hutsoniella sourekii]|uniref:phenylalanine--tRNA ligase subunit beta n=1 Tax=Hutsoniella sourekii TaxID=87650 RepID=UPI00047FF8DE|nr:phenylalanine--tRNA ligase subunit beta [Hutsoniella sourekii]